MKVLVFGTLWASLAFAPMVAAAAPASAYQHSYPIHYDGPGIHHAQPDLSTDAAAVSGNLPHFDLRFHGGPVQTSTVSYAIYWRPPGTYMSRTYRPLIDRFLADVGGSAIYGMATEYYGANGRVLNSSRFGGSWIDTSAYPTHRITDADLQIEVLKAVSANRWKPGINAQFFVMTAKDALPTVPFSAYHSAFDYGFGSQIAQYPYAFIPYVGSVNGCNVPFGLSPNNDTDSDGSILNLSHEQTEMVTDPLLNAWYDERNGEVGDICIFSFGVPINTQFTANLVIGTDPYFLQEEYSQAKQSCQPNL
ncbi:MAG: EXORDIUM family protein [Candidatus Eremiobacteraeota bacterium]|nr:EXORDIUM family protein [Candidatus Eremiobacteraeota bacterium]